MKRGLVLIVLLLTVGCMTDFQQESAVGKPVLIQPTVQEDVPPMTNQQQLSVATNYLTAISTGVYQFYPQLKLHVVEHQVTNLGTENLEVKATAELQGFSSIVGTTEVIGPGKTVTVALSPTVTKGFTGDSVSLHYQLSTAEGVVVDQVVPIRIDITDPITTECFEKSALIAGA
jgi:hypothetical protein